MNINEKFRGCIISGAIGDAWGSGFENQFEEEDDTFYLLGKSDVKLPEWGITDDTQLTLATCEAIIESNELNPEIFAKQYLKLYKNRILRGVGSSTLKSLQELEAGGHWSQVGRRGEYAAGNGAAMRMAPLAFCANVTNERIRDISIITHNNDEAYIGARSVIIAIQSIIENKFTSGDNLMEVVIDSIPDTRIRDRLIEILKLKTLEEVSKLGNDGYVVNSIPFALAAANKYMNIGIEPMFKELIKLGGDTDTNCSIAGQIVGAYVGIDEVPINLLNKLKEQYDYKWIDNVIQKFVENNKRV